MKLIDRYILKRFLSTFLFVLSALSLVICFIDFVEKQNAMLQHNLSYTEILDYYSAYVLFIINFITPITVFIAAVFVTCRLAQHTEIIAVISGGISFARFLLPYLLGAAVVGLCNFGMTGWWLAKANQKRVAFEEEYLSTTLDAFPRHMHVCISPEQYLYVEQYRSQRRVGTGVTLETIRGNRLIEKISAQKMSWMEEHGRWRLHDWISRKIRETGEEIRGGSRLDVSLDMNPKDFVINPKLHETLTLPELLTHIRVLSARGAASIPIFVAEKHVRCMTPFAPLILTCMGVVISSRKSRRGIGMRVAFGFVLAALYIALFLFARGFAESKGAYLGLIIWAPNLLFATVSGYLYKVVPK